MRPRREQVGVNLERPRQRRHLTHHVLDTLRARSAKNTHAQPLRNFIAKMLSQRYLQHLLFSAAVSRNAYVQMRGAKLRTLTGTNLLEMSGDDCASSIGASHTPRCTSCSWPSVLRACMAVERMRWLLLVARMMCSSTSATSRHHEARALVNASAARVCFRRACFRRGRARGNRTMVSSTKEEKRSRSVTQCERSNEGATAMRFMVRVIEPYHAVAGSTKPPKPRAFQRGPAGNLNVNCKVCTGYAVWCPVLMMVIRLHPITTQPHSPSSNWLLGLTGGGLGAAD